MERPREMTQASLSYEYGRKVNYKRTHAGDAQTTNTKDSIDTGDL